MLNVYLSLIKTVSGLFPGLFLRIRAGHEVSELDGSESVTRASCWGIPRSSHAQDHMTRRVLAVLPTMYLIIWWGRRGSVGSASVTMLLHSQRQPDVLTPSFVLIFFLFFEKEWSEHVVPYLTAIRHVCQEKVC